MEFPAGRVEGALLVFGCAGDERPVFIIENCEQDLVDRPLSEPRGFMQIRDDFATEEPQVVAMLTQGFAR